MIENFEERLPLQAVLALEEHSVWSCEVAKQAEILQKAGSLWEQVPHNRDVVCIVWSKWSNI